MSNIDLIIYKDETEIPLQIIFPEGEQGPPGQDGTGILTVEFTEADLQPDGWGGFLLPIDLEGKRFHSAEIEQEGAIEFKSIDSLSKQPGWATPRLSGFANNNEQKITITLLG